MIAKETIRQLFTDPSQISAEQRRALLAGVDMSALGASFTHTVHRAMTQIASSPAFGAAITSAMTPMLKAITHNAALNARRKFRLIKGSEAETELPTTEHDQFVM